MDCLTATRAFGFNEECTDAYGRTSLPDVYAIGDCALHANRYAGGPPIRLECVQNANDLATIVAQTLTGDPAPYDKVS